ncbi:hypothetical protein BGZ99_003445 [Dissophora globulifera]|uniref:Protein kinase domain-containing protein n=1 Tax=Dissophora globulifera TaxID=979702 RepID=A0A9P6RQ02_9FUNG|nr:hypothetical protein BGZ99_003445 [Dissophora globulifera]
MSVLRARSQFGAGDSVNMNSIPSLAHSNASSAHHGMDVDSIPVEGHQNRIRDFGQYIQDEQQQQLQQQQQRQQQPYSPGSIQIQKQRQAQHQARLGAVAEHQDRPRVAHFPNETQMPSLTRSQGDHSTMASTNLLSPGAGADIVDGGYMYYLNSVLSTIPAELAQSTASSVPLFEFPRDFSDVDKVSMGGNGEIRKAYCSITQCKVILKTLMDVKQVPSKVAAMFNKEVEVMRICGNHDNLVRFYGVAYENNEGVLTRHMVMHRYRLGDLAAVLEKSAVPEPPTLVERFSIALDIAKGLDHLMQCGFHHGDLHPKNILIDLRQGSDELSSDHLPVRFQARLTDFGLRRLRDPSNMLSSQPLAGVWPFMAPERMPDLENLNKPRPRYNAQCDIFALGVIYWYLIAGRYPFKGVTSNYTPLLRETRVEGTPDWYHALYTQAWAEDPRDRQGSIGEIIDVLRHQLGLVSSIPPRAHAGYPTPSVSPMPCGAGSAPRGATPTTPSSNSNSSAISTGRSSNPNHPRYRQAKIPNGMPSHPS